MTRSLRAIVFRYMIAVIAVTAIIRITLWLVYQAYEASLGHVVFHEQINEALLLLLVEVLALAFLGFMLWQLSRKVLSPIRSVANAAQLISQGKLEKRIRTAHLPEGELSEIANALNDSFDRYQDAIDRISRFSSDASHQLRTPLTAIRNTAELSLSRAQSPEEYQRALVSILEESEHLGRMIEQLLLLSRMDAEQLRDSFALCNLTDILKRSVEVYEPVLESRNVRLNLNLTDACTLLGDETLLVEATMNLVDNAVKWSPDGGELTISTATDGDRSVLTVSDSGPGIPDAFRDNLFERFNRHSTSPYKGSGLGLSIVAEVTKLHDGSIAAGKGEHGGAKFTLSFPAAEKSSEGDATGEETA